MPGLSCLMILSKSRKPLIMTSYKNDISVDCPSIINIKMIENYEDNFPPMFQENGMSFFYKKHQNIFVVGVGKGEQDAIQQICFLDSVVEMLKEFFGEVNMKIVMDNKFMISEMLSEIANNGWPQVTEKKMVKKFLIYNTNKISFEKSKKNFTKDIKLKAPWKYKHHHHAKNKIFLDVFEKINMIIDPKGKVLRSEVERTIHMNSKSSGILKLKLGLNDKKSFNLRKSQKLKKRKLVEIQDIKFHSCVQLDTFENEGMIMFVPPVGEFDLIKYRINCALKPLFSVNIAYLKETDTSCFFEVRIRTKYKKKIFANFIKFFIPLPKDTQALEINCSSGSSEFIPNKNVVVWSLTQFKGFREAYIEVEFKRSFAEGSSFTDFKSQPIQVEFEIPQYTFSELNVKYLKVSGNSNNDLITWIRYLTQSGKFVIRV